MEILHRATGTARGLLAGEKMEVVERTGVSGTKYFYSFGERKMAYLRCEGVAGLPAADRIFGHWQTHPPDRSGLFPVIRTIRREIGATVANLCARVAPACRIG